MNPSALREHPAREGASLSRLRVLHLASGDGWGGAERALSLLVEGTLAEGSVDVEVLLLNEGRLAATLRGLGADVHVEDEQRISFVQLVAEIRRRARRGRIDVVHAHRYKELLLGALATRPGRRGLVTTVHGLEPAAQMSAGRSLQLWGVAFVARLLGARFVAVSGEIEQRLRRRLGAGRLHLIGNPMAPLPRADAPPDLRTRVGWSADRRVVGFVGRLETVKGPDLFLDLAAAHRGGAGFVLIGGGSLEPALHERVRREGLDARVKLLGEVSDAAGLLGQLDVLAVTSRHEGLPMVVLEAAAGHVPVVAFGVGGLGEILDGSFAARRIEPGDVAAFATAVDEVLAARERARSEAARWGDSLRERYSLTRTVESYLDVYRAAARR